VDWEYCSSILELVTELKSSSKINSSIEQAKETLLLNKSDKIHIEELVLVFENEVHGVHQEVINISNYVIEIPQFATKHSLKDSVCTRAVLWELIC
jgi:tRNA G18 (ribose-2'-O)-methylase SpoU